MKTNKKKIMKRNGKKVLQNKEPESGKEIMHRPIFHHDLKTNSRVVHCSCRWVFQWHCRWGFPCQRRSANKRHNSIANLPKTGPLGYKKRKRGSRKINQIEIPERKVINTEDKVTETLEIERKDKATETDVVGQTKNKKTNTNWKVNLKDKSTSCQSLEKVDQSTQFDDTHVNRLLPSPPVDPARSDERPRKSGDQTSGTESKHSEEEDDAKEDGDNRESLTGERLPKPFHRINIFGKTLKENVEKVPELLKRGLRVIKGPNYDHEKLTAVPGDYIGTVICVDFEEDLPEVWEYTKEKITKIAVFRRGKSGNAFGKEYVDRFNKPQLVTNQLNTYVEVQWDNGQRELCAIGPLKFELLVYNTNEIHDNFMCNGCNEEPIIGTRWTCVTCKFRNLCTSCYMANKYNRNHVFQRIMMKGGKGPEMPSRASSTDIGKRHEAYGVTTGSRVSFVNDDMQGKVLGRLKETVYRYTINGVIYPLQNMAPYTRVSVTKGIRVKEPCLPCLNSEMVQCLPGIRVMMKVTLRINKSESESKYIVGAILAYRKIGKSKNVRVVIQWDAELNTGSFIVTSQESRNNPQLLLFDTGLKTETECIRCRIDIKGITWKNGNNQPFCTMCYMRFADEFNCTFTWECGNEFRGDISREKTPDKWTVLLFVENESVEYQTIESRKTCLSLCGFQKVSGVDTTDNRKGKLVRDSILNPMTVQSINGLIFMRDICDLKIQIGIEKNNDCHFYYQDHLHLLGEDETEFYDAQVKHFNKNQEQVSKIQVQVWKKEASMGWENSFRPVLHFIFVDQSDDILRDVLNLLSNSRISCHLVYDQVVLWHNRQENIQSCGVHENTRKETITKLLDNNFRMFKVMKEESRINKDGRKVKGKKKRKGLLQRNKNCSNIGYFIDIAERFFGEKVMPVIVTAYAIEEMEKCIQDKANEAEIPILSFEDSSYVSVLWSSESCMKKGSKVKEESSKRATNLNTDCCFPRGCFCKNMSSVSPNNNPTTDEDLRVTEASESNMNMSQPSTSKDKKLKLENKYEVDRTKPWIVREWQKDQALETDIDNQRCLISKAINKDFVRLVASTIVGVVIHKLKSLRRRSQTVPRGEMLLYVRSLSCQLLKDGQWMFPGEYISTLKTLDDIFNQKSIEYIYEKNMKNEFKSGLWEELRTATKSAYRPPKITEDSQLILTKDCAGVDLVFFALLKKKRLDGGTQLIEKGCVGVRSILIGAKILVKHAEEWRISEAEKKDFEDLAIKFNQHAFSIMNYIHEKDELERLRSPKGWVNNIKHFFIKEDEVSGKAGRLLLNHGYLEVAYKTKNECFLENPKLKTMIKELWYGDEYQSRRKIDTILRLFLCIMHVFIMPIMLFTLDKPSWIYKKYHTPILKLWINTAGLMSFLAAFAYMLLFDYKENGVSQSEFAVLFWILNKSVDEFHQICVAVYRDTKRKREKSFLSEYGQDMWNRLDLIIILTSFLGFIVKLLFEDNFLQGFAKIMFLISYIMLNIRVLNMFWTSEFLGSQLVIIQKKIKITSAFMTIMIVIMMCYNVVDYALLYPNTEFTWTEIENIVRNGYWTLYGDFQEDVGNDCTDNATLYSQGIQQRCPSFLGALLSPYLRAIYCLIAILMLLNMLIAIYTKTSDSVHDKSRIYWSQLQSNFLEEYKIRTIFPVHFKICCLGALVFHLLIYIVMKMYGIQREEQALFIKVLVFDDNFDVDPEKETPEEMAEKNGMLEMQGERENEDFEGKSIEQNIISGQSDIEEDGHQINCKPPDEEVDKKINKIIQEVNEVKRVWENKDIRERKTNSF